MSGDLDRAPREPGFGGRFFDRAARQLEKLDDLPLAIGEPGHRDVQEMCIARLGRDDSGRERGRFGLGPKPPLFSPGNVTDAMPRDRVEPGSERPLRIIGVQRAMHGDQRLLDDVVDRRFTEPASRIVADDPRYLGERRLIRLSVPCLCQGHERRELAIELLFHTLYALGPRTWLRVTGEGAGGAFSAMKRLDLRVHEAWALVPLRLILGFGFLAHGVAKFSRGPEHFGAILGAIGVPVPVVTAWVTTWIEIVGGLAVMLGLATELVAVPLIVVMLTAMATVHWPYGFSTIKLQAVGPGGARFGNPGYELNLLYIAGLAALALSPPSRFSIDRWRATQITQPQHTVRATSASAAESAGPSAAS